MLQEHKAQIVSSTTKVKPHIRWMIRRDMPEVLAIEEAQFFPYSWTEQDFLITLRQKNVVGMVAEDLITNAGGPIIGYMVYELRKKDILIVNLAVHPDYTRQGIGTRMLAKLKSKLSSHRRSKLKLRVREGNLSAQLFFKSQEFEAKQILQDFYEDSEGDAYEMVYRVPEGMYNGEEE